MRPRSSLRPAQVALNEEMTAYPRGIAVLGMGGGKTATALTTHLDLVAAGEIDRTIVLAPARVVDNVWPNEPAKWEHLQGIDVVAVVGTPAKRAKLLNEEHDVYVVSIDNTQWLLDQLVNWPLARTALVIDEISRMKNPRSVRGKELFAQSHRFASVWGLTGTPRPNGYEDLWMPIRVVSGEHRVWGEIETMSNGQRGLTTTFDAWRQFHFYPLDYLQTVWEPHRHFIPKLDAVANEWMVRGSVDDLNLHPLNTGDEFVRWVDPTEEQVARYEQMQEEMITAGRAEGLSGDALVDWVVTAMSQGVASGKLTQIVQGFLYLPGDEAAGRKAHKIADNPKLAALADMDESLGHDRAVICYGYREEIDHLCSALSHRTTALIGGGVGPREAKRAIDDWNAGKIDRLLIHPASAGHGIELQFGGHHMIWYHPTWSPELYDQTIKRLHRPGQEFEVFNWQIAMTGTNDEIKLARVLNKRDDETAFKSKLRSLI